MQTSPATTTKIVRGEIKMAVNRVLRTMGRKADGISSETSMAEFALSETDMQAFMEAVEQEVGVELSGWSREAIIHSNRVGGVIEAIMHASPHSIFLPV